jgi:hypothetical protein
MKFKSLRINTRFKYKGGVYKKVPPNTELVNIPEMSNACKWNSAYIDWEYGYRFDPDEEVERVA